MGDIPGHHLVQEDPGRVDIGPAIGIAMLDLLGRQVGDGADDEAGGRTRVVRGQRPRQAEVGDLHSSVIGDEDVLGLDVAVDEAGGVRGGQAFEDWFEHDEGLLAGERPELVDDIAKIAPRDVLQCEVDEPGRGALVVDRDHMGMGQARRRLGLAVEPGDEVWILGEMTVHDLEGDDAVEPKVERLVDGCHAAAGEQCEHLIALIDRLTDECFLRRRHHDRDPISQDRSRAAATRGTGGSRAR